MTFYRKGHRPRVVLIPRGYRGSIPACWAWVINHGGTTVSNRRHAVAVSERAGARPERGRRLPRQPPQRSRAGPVWQKESGAFAHEQAAGLGCYSCVRLARDLNASTAGPKGVA